MKKVMHVIHGLNTGGAETLVKNYALKMDKNNFEVVILCFDHYYDSPYEKILEDNDVRVIYVCDYMKFYGSKNPLLKLFNKIEKYLIIKRHVKNEKPDIIHTHLQINRYIKFSKPKKSVSLFHTVHNEPIVLWRRGKFNRRLDFLSTKCLVKKYNMRFIVLHEEMKKEVNKLFHVSNSVVLNNGIDFNCFNGSVNNNLKKYLKIPNDAFVIGHIGRFTEQKNHSFLVDVFYSMYKKHKNSFLLMIGSGTNKESIERKLDDLGLNGHYLILSNRNDIPDLLSIMDIFVFPSIFEGLGIVLIEAQKMKVPCFISTAVPKNATISNLVTRLSLDLEPSEWAKIIFDYKKPEKIVLDDKDWNMVNVVKKLEDIYLDKI